jgi:DNA-binding CsgD family transcriptional regulator
MTLVAHIPGADTVADALRRLPPDPSTGGRMLDGVLALRATFDNRRAEARERALRAIADGALARHPLAESSLAGAWTALIACGSDGTELVRSFDDAIEHTRARGSLRALGPAGSYRGLWSYHCGSLRDAVTAGRSSWDVAMTYGTALGKAFSGSYLIPSLVAHGQLTQAGSVADELGSVFTKVPYHVSASAFAGLAAARGDIDDAIGRALAGRANCVEYGVRNPVMAGWRSTLIRCLMLRQRHDDARAQVVEAMSWASEWGTDAELGRALYCASLVEQRDSRTELLREAVGLLEGTHLTLDLARARCALGDAYRRAKNLPEAKRHLEAALHLARTCGAPPLVETCVKSLRMMGARQAASSVLGPRSLTPGELRAAELAARGLSNKEIAQSLYVTVKTVEVHLSSAYRKLGIARRQELARALDPGTGR